MSTSYTIKGEGSSYTYTATTVSAEFSNPWSDSVGASMHKRVGDSLRDINDAQQAMIKALSKLGDLGDCKFEYTSMRHQISLLEVK